MTDSLSPEDWKPAKDDYMPKKKYSHITKDQEVAAYQRGYQAAFDGKSHGDCPFVNYRDDPHPLFTQWHKGYEKAKGEIK
jgi:ribosome modulation factor